MKTSININLFGTIYAIDEDAHQLLKQYIDNMRIYFAKQTGGDEIADDIEHRIAELFWAQKEKGNESIDLQQVKEIIEKIGNPEQMDSQTEPEGENSSANESQRLGVPGETTDNGSKKDNSNNAEDNMGATPSENAMSWFKNRRFYRDPTDKLMGGVISGATHYFGGNDSLPWRLGFIILCIVLSDYFFYITGVYLLFWLLAPEARSAEDRLRMQGKEVNPDSIKTEILKQQTGQYAPQSQAHGCLSSGVTVIAVIVKVLFILIGVFILFCIFVPLVVVLFSVLFGVTMSQGTNIFTPEASQILSDQHWLIIGGLFALILIIALPLYGIYRLLRSHSLKPLTPSHTALLVLLWVAALTFEGYAFMKIETQIKGVDIFSNLNLDDFDENGSAISEYYNTDSISFDAISFCSVGKVIFTQGDSCSFRVEGKPSALTSTQINVQDGELQITQSEEGNNHDGITIRVTAPQLSHITLEGVGKMQLKDTLKQDSPLMVKMEGVGAIDADYIECPKLVIDQNGVGGAKFNQHTDTLIIHSEGVGSVKVKGETRIYEKNSSSITSKVNDNDLKIAK